MMTPHRLTGVPMNQELLAKVLACDQLPSLPAVAVKVIELTANMNVRLDDLASTIQDDQGLAAKVLKTVNSSFYGLRKPCSTINQALVMLGLSAVKSLALSFSLVSSLDQKRDSAFDYVSYWRRGLYTGVAAKMIAHRACLPTEDEAFLGGLLQDIGMIALYRAVRQPYTDVLLEAGDDHRGLVKAEIAALEVQHPDVGAMLAQKWKLPDELVMPVKYHERPAAAPVEHAALVRCVALGNLAHDALAHPDRVELVSRFLSRCKDWFSIGESEAEDMLRVIGQYAREMSTLFRLDIGESNDAEAILARAKAQREEIRTSPQAAADPARMSGLVTDGDEFDALTGVATRLSGTRWAEDAFERAKSSAKNLTILAVMIDGFADTIARHGPHGGDVILVETASLLQEHYEVLGGTVARWESGTFLVIVPGLDRLESVRAATETSTAIQRHSTRWTSTSGAGLKTSARIGVATVESSGSPFVKVQQVFTAAIRAAESAAIGEGQTVRAFVPRAVAA